jgi:UDP-glucose 4-epimerase
MKRTIVTGGCGFIGSHLVERLLRDGSAVTVIDNLKTGRRKNLQHLSGSSAVDVVELDVCEQTELKTLFRSADCVFHLAALADIVPSIERPEEYFRANVDGTFSVMQAARAANVPRVMYAASSSCYGIPDNFPTPETAQIRPQYPYALTKFLGEQIVLHWGKVYGLNVTSLRLFNVYGPRARTTGTYGAVFGVFLAQKLAGKPMTVVGNGKQTRDFTFVTDVVDAFVRAARSSSLSGEILNVGSGNTYSVNRLVELLGGETTNIPKRPGEPETTFADVTRISSSLDWKASVSFEDGVARMLSHIDDWKDAPVWNSESIAEATKTWFSYLQDTPSKS